MTPYAITVAPHSDLQVLAKIIKVMEYMPDIELPDKEEVSCHMIARALAEFFPVQYKDGYFPRKGYQHSWLVTQTGNVIDAYPWAIVGGPVMLDMRLGSPWNGMFQAHPLLSLENEEFKRNTQTVTEAMREVINKLGIKPEPLVVRAA
ncbi:MAG: hypothetical protein WD898_01205 [Candidatus Paceibacterota bacterium]